MTILSKNVALLSTHINAAKASIVRYFFTIFLFENVKVKAPP